MASRRRSGLAFVVQRRPKKDALGPIFEVVTAPSERGHQRSIAAHCMPMRPWCQRDLRVDFRRGPLGPEGAADAAGCVGCSGARAWRRPRLHPPSTSQQQKPTAGSSLMRQTSLAGSSVFEGRPHLAGGRRHYRGDPFRPIAARWKFIRSPRWRWRACPPECPGP
jgi:hypothetical protein